MSESSSSDNASSGGWRTALWRIKHNILGTERTVFDAEFTSKLNDARVLGAKTKMLIKAVKKAAQSNPSYESTIVPPDNVTVELTNLTEQLIDIAAFAKGKSDKTSDHYTKMAKALTTCQAAKKTFWGQVRSSVLTPLEKYLNEDLVKIEEAFKLLDDIKVQYDELKNQLKLCQPEKIDEINNKLVAKKDAFEKHANHVSEILEKLPDHLEAQRKAVRNFGLAYRQMVDTMASVMLKSLKETAEQSPAKS